MPSSHCTILARFFSSRQVLINHRQKPGIGGKSMLVHARDNHSMNYQRRDLRESPMRRRHLWNIWQAKYLELSVNHNPAMWMSSDWKIHQRWPTANERTRHRAAGSSERNYLKKKAIYKQRAYILALDYTDQVGYITTKKGLGIFL